MWNIVTHQICVALLKLINYLKTKIMSKINFYSAEEVQTLTNELNSGKPARQIAKEYSKKWNRSKGAVEVKIYSLRRNNETSNVQVVKTAKKGRPVKNVQPAKIQAGVELPSGFVFDFQPKKAEMYANHVRLYF